MFQSVLKVTVIAGVIYHCCVGLAISQVTLPQPSDRQGVTTEDDIFSIVEAVIDHHPRLKQENAAIEGVRSQILAARAAYRPSVSLRATTGESEREGVFAGGSEFDEQISPRSASVEVNQLLYNGGKRKLDMQSALLGVASSESRLQDLQNNVVRDVVSKYLKLEYEQRVYAIRLDIVKLLEQQLSTAKRRKRSGAAAQPEIAQIEARLSEANAELIFSRLGIDVAKSELSMLAGFDITNVSPSPLINLPAASLDEFIEQAHKVSPILNAIETDHRIAGLQLQKAKRETWPTFNLYARAQNAKENSATLERDEDYSVGVNFTMPLYTGGASKAEKRRAAAGKLEALYTYETAKQELDRQIMQAWATRAVGQASLDASRRRLDYEKTAFKAVNRGRRGGANSIIDVLTAVENYLEAELSLIEADIALKEAAFSLALYSQKFSEIELAAANQTLK